LSKDYYVGKVWKPVKKPLLDQQTIAAEEPKAVPHTEHLGPTRFMKFPADSPGTRKQLAHLCMKLKPQETVPGLEKVDASKLVMVYLNL